MRKYLSIWHRNAQYIPLLENAKIISTFCKTKLDGVLVRKKWRKLYKKFLFSERQYNIMKILKKIKKRKYKLIKLIRMTRLITIFNKRKFLHYIVMYWLIYTLSTIKKRNQIKMLYENMLTTYVSMADDIFGKNQKNNPSIQDCMFEIIDTDKYQVKRIEDVPIAKVYYSKKSEEKKIITNVKYIEKELEVEKDYTIYKETNKKYYSKEKNNKNEYREKSYEKRNKTDEKELSYKKVYNTNTNKSANNYNTIYKGKSEYGSGNYTYKGRRNEPNIIDTTINKENDENSQKRKYIKTNYSFKGNNNKTDIDTNINDKNDKIQYGSNYSYKGKIINTDGNRDINNRSQGATKRGGATYNNRRYNKTEPNVKENSNEDSRSNLKLGRNKYTFKSYNNTESNYDSIDNKNNNNRYLDMNTDENNYDAQQKEQKEGRYSKYRNRSYNNTIENKEQKKDEKIIYNNNSYYRSINNNKNENNRISQISNEEIINNNSENYSNKNRPEGRTFYRRHFISSNKYNNDGEK
jgi:hypothetical protein